MILFKKAALNVALLGAFTFVSATSIAQTTAEAASPAPAYELAYNVGVVSDYRYRGISQTRLQPALQGGVDLTAGAWYAGVWASNIKWIKDLGPGSKGPLELDLYGGYKYEVNKNLTLDVGALSYVYPSNNVVPNANTTEIYIGAASGPFSAKYSHAVTNTFGYPTSKGSNYLEANVDYELVKGTNLVAHIGRQSIKNNAAASYTDYKLGVTYEALGGKFAASYVDASKDFLATAPNGKNTSKGGIVVGYTKTF
jgi:uncharacterized protein (TIGR02001 family)